MKLLIVDDQPGVVRGLQQGIDWAAEGFFSQVETAFNALEAAALENRAASLAELARESGYLQGLDEGRASVLPRLREERGRAAQLALSFTPARKAQLRKALRYAGMGLTNREIARLLGSSHTTVNTLIKQGRELGLVREEQRQCGLPGVTA